MEEINLSRNTIQDIPENVTKLDKLRNLNCEETGLTAFPTALCNLMGLQVLNLSQNKISSLPSASSHLKNMISLKELYMNNCDLRGWSQLYLQIKMQILHLNNNQIHGIPPEVSNLMFLEELRLHKNSISHVPDYISNFKLLKVLDLSCNTIVEVDETLGDLEHLEILLLQNNQISLFPDSASKLSNLVELNLSENRIEKLPDVSKWTKLKFLDISNNRIKCIPNGFCYLTKLEKLDLTLNNITYLPDDFYNLVNLDFLRLKHNEIESISEKITQMTKLEEINVDNNALGLSGFPLHCLSALKNLKHISMNYNFPAPFVVSDELKLLLQQSNVKIDSEFEHASSILEKLYLGSANTATSKTYLKSLGITHILTAAGELPARFPDVCFHNNFFYFSQSFTYMIIHVEDSRTSSLRPHFQEWN